MTCVTSEHSKGKLGVKEKAVFSLKYMYLFVYPFGPKSIKFTLVGGLDLQKCVEFSSELNGTLVRSLMTNMEI